jgi:hypothetical protein
MSKYVTGKKKRIKLIVVMLVCLLKPGGMLKCRIRVGTNTSILYSRQATSLADPPLATPCS